MPGDERIGICYGNNAVYDSSGATCVDGMIKNSAVCTGEKNFITMKSTMTFFSWSKNRHQY